METKNKFHTGINNQQCIGPCYPAGEYITHPVNLNTVHLEEHKPFCPTMPWKKNENDLLKFVDECLVPDNMNKYTKEEIVLNYVAPTIGYSYKTFLKTFYNIVSFEEAVDYISNNKSPLYTQLRIMNAAWKSYGINADIINDQLLEFYVNLVKKQWIKYIYSHIAKFIYVDKNQIYIKENNAPINENKIEKINYFNKKFNNTQIMYSVLSSYLKENKSMWDDIIDYNDNIKKYYVKYVLDKIKNTMD